MKKLEGYVLYRSRFCPYCHVVYNAMKSLGLSLEERDIDDETNREALLRGGGKAMVPCLRHPDGRWQYESADIVQFLKKNFAA